ncbi:hypothetical protein GCM10023340_33480 [Nocardioides marinquilinus]|uniref:Uncharacterized protein n=1 Tax=Nocardioides marinquilinus TaxID=1210400 RepID=A0ABP9PXL7_9ACTN
MGPDRTPNPPTDPEPVEGPRVTMVEVRGAPATSLETPALARRPAPRTLSLSKGPSDDGRGARSPRDEPRDRWPFEASPATRTLSLSKGPDRTPNPPAPCGRTPEMTTNRPQAAPARDFSTGRPQPHAEGRRRRPP